MTLDYTVYFKELINPLNYSGSFPPPTELEKESILK